MTAADAILDALRDEVGQEPASWLALADALTDDGLETVAWQVRSVAVLLAEAHDSRLHLRALTTTALAWLSVDPVHRCRVVDAYRASSGGVKGQEWDAAGVRRIASTPARVFVADLVRKITLVRENTGNRPIRREEVDSAEQSAMVVWTTCFIKQETSR